MATNPKLIIQARIQGAGGQGNYGGSLGDAGDGQPGGDALLVEALFDIDNSQGQLWSGGGGGGGGGGKYVDGDTVQKAGGGAGGGGAGDVPGDGSSGGISGGYGVFAHGQSSAAGTLDVGANGGVPSGGAGFMVVGSAAHYASSGGKGGDPGEAGQDGFDGALGQPEGGFIKTANGTGGAAGKYVSGNSFVTWIATGDRRGNVS